MQSPFFFSANVNKVFYIFHKENELTSFIEEPAPASTSLIKMLEDAIIQSLLIIIEEYVNEHGFFGIPGSLPPRITEELNRESFIRWGWAVKEDLSKEEQRVVESNLLGLAELREAATVITGQSKYMEETTIHSSIDYLKYGDISSSEVYPLLWDKELESYTEESVGCTLRSSLSLEDNLYNQKTSLITFVIQPIAGANITKVITKTAILGVKVRLIILPDYS